MTRPGHEQTVGLNRPAMKGACLRPVGRAVERKASRPGDDSQEEGDGWSLDLWLELSRSRVPESPPCGRDCRHLMSVVL